MTATLPALVSTLKTRASSPRDVLESFGELEVDDLVTANVVWTGDAEEAGAVDDSLGSSVQEHLAVFGGFEASADLAGEAFADHFDEGAVVAEAHGGVEIDELDERILGEALDPVFEVVEGKF